MEKIWTIEGLDPYIEKFLDGENKGKIEEIGDGNINYVCRYTSNKGRTLIFKKACDYLKSSGRPLDQGRIVIEEKYLEIASGIDKDKVPKIYCFDKEKSLIVMEDIGEYKNLRSLLCSGRIYEGIGESLALFLAKMITKTSSFLLSPEKKKDLVREFINPEMCEISEDLVFTEPYYDYKKRNNVFKGEEEFVKKNLYENKELRDRVIEMRMKFLNSAESLIHGDLHSGSIFANENGIKIIDSEFAFVGPSGYDLGNVYAHLLIAKITGKAKGFSGEFFKKIEFEIKTFNKLVFENIEKILLRECNLEFY